MRENGLGVVIGASVLGIGIAAQLANAGWRVRLLDGSGEHAGKALSSLRNARPPLLFLPEYLDRIEPGSLNDLTICKEADWIVEALPENLEQKRRLYHRLELFLGPETIVTTTAHFLSLASLLEGSEDVLKERLFAAHFIAPPRYHKLVEVAATPSSDLRLLTRFCAFLEERLGHRVVRVHDSPGFVATRVGTAHFFDILHLAIESGLDVEQVDALTGALIGRPHGIFQWADTVGLETLAQQAHALAAAFPNDPLHHKLTLPPVLAEQLREHRWQGFHTREGNLVVDLETGNYRPAHPTTADANDPFLIWVQESLFAYLDSIRPQIAPSEREVDQAMEWGFGWSKGPFVLEAERRGRLYAAPSPAPEYLELSHWPVVTRGGLGSLYDLGDGVACYSLHPPQNRLTVAMLTALVGALERVEQEFLALVVTSEGPSFTVGFSLDSWWRAAQRGEFTTISRDIQTAQSALLRLAAARVPVVGALRGQVTGGGAELALHLPYLHLSPETYFGFPQVHAGLLPCFGGIAELFEHTGDVRQVLQVVMGGQVSTSAHDAQKRGFLRPTDTITRNADRLLYEARLRALELSDAPMHHVPVITDPCEAQPLRESMQELRAAGRITVHELRLAQAVIQVLCGGPTDPQAIRERERLACLELCEEPLTHARLQYLLTTGHPLRN